jgi:hypothetical protein
MIAMLTVMSNMNLSHDQLGLVGLDLPGLSLVCMVWLQVECMSVLVGFGYRCDSCELEALDYRG